MTHGIGSLGTRKLELLARIDRPLLKERMHLVYDPNCLLISSPSNRWTPAQGMPKIDETSDFVATKAVESHSKDKRAEKDMNKVLFIARGTERRHTEPS